MIVNYCLGQLLFENNSIQIRIFTKEIVLGQLFGFLINPWFLYKYSNTA